MVASHAGVSRGARFSSLLTFVGRDEKWAPLKTPAWEAKITADFFKKSKMWTRFRKVFFCESIWICKFYVHESHHKWKKPMEIALSSWKFWLKNYISDFCQVHLFFCYKQMKLGITSQELKVYAQFDPIFIARKQGRIDFSWNNLLAYTILQK